MKSNATSTNPFASFSKENNELIYRALVAYRNVIIETERFIKTSLPPEDVLTMATEFKKEHKAALNHIAAINSALTNKPLQISL